MQKGQVLIFIILAIVAAGFAGVMFYAGKQTPNPQSQVVTSTPSPTPSSSPIDETANWKTYTNTSLGYEFKYPDNLNLKGFNLGADEKITVLTDMKLTESAVYPDNSEVLVQSTGGQDWSTPAIYKGFIMDIRNIPTYRRLKVGSLKDAKKINNLNVTTSEETFKNQGYEGVHIYTVMVDDSYQKQFDISTDLNSSKLNYKTLFNKILETFKIL